MTDCNTQNKAHQDALKRLAAQKAVELVPEGQIIGIGTGSTVNCFIEALAQSSKKIKGAVSTSNATTKLLEKYEIPVFALSEVHSLPIYFDGADEINHSLQMIKGGGGALFQEKLVASSSEIFVCMADQSKYVSRLGKFPLPIEVLPAARSFVARHLLKLGISPELRVGFITDNGNSILDCPNFYIDEPLQTEKAINEIVGVIECGIFARRRADKLVLARESGVEILS